MIIIFIYNRSNSKDIILHEYYINLDTGCLLLAETYVYIGISPIPSPSLVQSTKMLSKEVRDHAQLLENAFKHKISCYTRTHAEVKMNKCRGILSYIPILGFLLHACVHVLYS